MKLPISNHYQAERILADGERVDGSSLFKGMVDTALSDLYVISVYKTAFLNPFDKDSLDFTCRYLTQDGNLAVFALDNILYHADQLEIEFLPAPIVDAGDHLVLARWLIRNIAYKYGCVATSTPKIEEGIAGNGLHVHMELRHNGKNIMTAKSGTLSAQGFASALSDVFPYRRAEIKKIRSPSMRSRTSSWSSSRRPAKLSPKTASP